MFKRFISFGSILLVLILAACAAQQEPIPETGAGTPPAADSMQMTPADETQFNINIENNAFVPAEVTVSAGTTVVWTNNDAVVHTVVSGTRDNPTELFDSGNLATGTSFNFTFDEPGTYEYFCSFHPGMSGTLIVE